MRKTLGIAMIAAGFLVAGNVVSRQSPSTVTATELKTIEMTAKKFEYSPQEIRVKKGARVQLKIRALDRTHGFKLELYPEGASEKGAPGLRFEAQPGAPQDKDKDDISWKLEKEQERVIEFIAERPGTYLFKCSVFCGLGHGGMKGKLIVEE